MEKKSSLFESNSLLRRSFAVQLNRLDRNERDIGFFKKQLGSYLVEPKTHEDFSVFYKLNTEVSYLENSCTFIYLKIRTHETALDQISNLIDTHLKRTKLLAHNISVYLEKIKKPETSNLEYRMSS